MATILRFIKPGDSSFDPDVTHLMGAAFDAACNAVAADPKPDYEGIAERIIAAAQRGERDPDRLERAGLAGSFTQDAAVGESS
jgi:hypothetical protein